MISMASSLCHSLVPHNFFKLFQRLNPHYRRKLQYFNSTTFYAGLNQTNYLTTIIQIRNHLLLTIYKTFFV